MKFVNLEFEDEKIIMISKEGLKEDMIYEGYQ